MLSILTLLVLICACLAFVVLAPAPEHKGCSI